MVRNFFTIALRAFWKHKVFSLINVIGLAIGMATFFLIYLYVSYERSYDTYHTNADRIYRLVVYDDRPTESQYNNSSTAMGPALLRDYPEIQAMVRITDLRNTLVSGDNHELQQDKIIGS